MAAGSIKKYELKANEYDIYFFLERVGNHDNDDCWIWNGAKVSGGYGVLRRKRDGKQITIFTHRLMWTIHNGEIPDDFVIDHLCKNRACCNPKHLEAVSDKENKSRATRWRGGRFPASSQKFRREKRGTCRKGHLWIEENKIVRKSGRVDCLPCRKIHNDRINNKVVA